MFDGFDGWLRIKGDSDEIPPYTVSEFIDHCNMVVEREFSDIFIEGEVSSFKINQKKWVFFDLKDEDSSVNCFLPVTSLNVAIADGMKVQLHATPKLTRWGKFSLTVHSILPVGEGNIKKSFELLKQKLTKAGLFDLAKKRPLPDNLTKIGVISSTHAAGYIDFLKILSNRWGGLKIQTINTQVQGLPAVDQILKALEYFNMHGDVELIALLRGGGSPDDLAIFNDERLVRAVAASRIPVLTGIGHEIDENLVDLAADLRASTPSNAAEMLVPDRQTISAEINQTKRRLQSRLLEQLERTRLKTRDQVAQLSRVILKQLSFAEQHLRETRKLLASLNPEQVLARGYAIVTGKLSPGSTIEIITHEKTLTAEVKHVKARPKNHS